MNCFTFLVLHNFSDPSLSVTKTFADEVNSLPRKITLIVDSNQVFCSEGTSQHSL